MAIHASRLSPAAAAAAAASAPSTASAIPPPPLGLNPLVYRWLVPIPAACILQVAFGLLYASGVFIVLLNDPLFTLSIGVAGFFTAVGITLAGIIMSRHPSRNAPTPPALLGAAALSLEAAMALALATHTPALLFISAALVGTGNGAIYVTSVDVLQAWVPDAPGRVTGLGMLCGSAGSLLGIHAYEFLSDLLHGPIPALAAAGLFSSAAALLAAACTSRPHPAWLQPQLPRAREAVLEQQLRNEDELFCLLPPSSSPPPPAEPTVLTVWDIVLDGQFYILLAAFAATAGPGFGFVLAFQRMVQVMFDVPVAKANDMFFYVILAGVAGRFAAGVAVDALQRGRRDDALYGAKRTNIILLITQAIALMIIPVAVRMGYVYCFTIGAAVVYATFSGGPVVTACLVRGIFMPNNASLAFSLAALSIGFGDFFFSWVIALCGKLALAEENSLLSPAHLGDYDIFFGIGLVWSVIGFLASAAIQVSSKVSEDRALKNVAG